MFSSGACVHPCVRDDGQVCSCWPLSVVTENIIPNITVCYWFPCSENSTNVHSITKAMQCSSDCVLVLISVVSRSRSREAKCCLSSLLPVLSVTTVFPMSHLLICVTVVPCSLFCLNISRVSPLCLSHAYSLNVLLCHLL